MLQRFGEILVILRESREPRMTQEKLIEELGARGHEFSRSFVANIETHRTKPSPEFLKGCEQIFGLPEGSLLRLSILHHIETWCHDNGVTVRHALDLAEGAQRVSYFLQRPQRSGMLAAVLERIKEMPGKFKDAASTLDRNEALLYAANMAMTILEGKEEWRQLPSERQRRSIMLSFCGGKVAFFGASLRQLVANYGYDQNYSGIRIAKSCYSN